MTTLSQRSGVTQLEFHQAMNDFKTMFPEMDEDVIEVVLRANNGAVDATIDQLLAMNLDSENERLRQELDSTDNNEVICWPTIPLNCGKTVFIDTTAHPKFSSNEQRVGHQWPPMAYHNCSLCNAKQLLSTCRSRRVIRRQRRPPLTTQCNRKQSLSTHLIDSSRAIRQTTILWLIIHQN